ncbi:MAG: hypothetical protein HY548_02270, partial [Elusimicrobia bacterium]|nr:hypothetical protein [Elusimicrobiota bacterium]
MIERIRKIGTSLGPVVFVGLACVSRLVPVHASLLDDEMRLSQQLQDQLQITLDQVFGKHKTAALVDVQLDLAPQLKKQFEKSWSESPAVKTSKESNAAPSALPWPSLGGSQDSLDLFSKKKSQAAQSVAGSPGTGSSPFSDPSFLLSAGLELKRLSVKVLLDQSLGPKSEETAEKVIAGVVALDPARGDRLVIDRVEMPSVRDELFRDPNVLLSLMQKLPYTFIALVFGGIILIIAIMAMGVFRSSTYRIAGALEALGTAATSHRLSVNRDAAAALGQTAGAGGDKALPLSASEEGKALEGEKSRRLLLDIKPGQVQHLHHLLKNEPIDNIALVVPHLPEKVRAAYLALQPPEKIAAILSMMSQIIMVEPELMIRLKEELEKRLSGSVGGIEDVVRILEAAKGADRKKLLSALQEKDPALAARVRAKVFMFEDLERFGDGDLALIFSQVKLDVLAFAMSGLNNGFQARVRAALTEFQQKAVDEILETRKPSEEKIQDARDQLVEVAQRLVRESRLAAPLLPGPEESRL